MNIHSYSDHKSLAYIVVMGVYSQWAWHRTLVTYVSAQIYIYDYGSLWMWLPWRFSVILRWAVKGVRKGGLGWCLGGGAVLMTNAYMKWSHTQGPSPSTPFAFAGSGESEIVIKSERQLGNLRGRWGFGGRLWVVFTCQGNLGALFALSSFYGRIQIVLWATPTRTHICNYLVYYIASIQVDQPTTPL